jgi:hypothetical protein
MEEAISLPIERIARFLNLSCGTVDRRSVAFCSKNAHIMLLKLAMSTESEELLPRSYMPPIPLIKCI